MALTRGDRLALLAAALVAAGVPLALLGFAPDPAAPAALVPALLAPRAAPSPSAAYARMLFGGEAPADAALPDDAPELAGIVGRIGSDAVALVRAADGTTRSVAIGEGVDGWTLTALAIDAASFSRGGQRVRVPLPAGD